MTLWDVCGARLYKVANLHKPKFVAGSGRQMHLRTGLRAIELLRDFPEVALQQEYARVLLDAQSVAFGLRSVLAELPRFLPGNREKLQKPSAEAVMSRIFMRNMAIAQYIRA